MTALSRFVKQHERIAFDSNVLIGFVEQVDYTAQAIQFFDAADRYERDLWTSVMTVPEVLIEPRTHKSENIVARYEQLLRADSLWFADIKLDTSRYAVELATIWKLATRDALHLASILEAGVTGFITADRDFAKVDDLAVFVLTTKQHRQKHR